MKRYFYTGNEKDGYTVRLQGGLNKPVATVCKESNEERKVFVIPGNGADETEVKKYCMNEGIWCPYNHEEIGKNLCIYRKESGQTVAVIFNKKIHILTDDNMERQYIKYYCSKVNKLWNEEFEHQVTGRNTLIIKSATGEAVAVIDNFEEGKVFTFFKWTGESEADIQEYCQDNKLL